MSSINKSNFKCPKCGIDVKLELWDSIDVSQNQELREKVLKREIYDFTCQKCGAEIDVVAFPFIYHDPKNKFAIHYFPNPTENDIIEFNTKATNFPYNRLRVVFEYEDLLDKIRIFEANLNDKVMEICKVIMLKQFGKQLNIQGYFTFFGFVNGKKSYVFHNTLVPMEENNKKPVEGSLYINYPLRTSHFDKDISIENGVYIEMAEEIYIIVESENFYNYAYLQNRWEVVDLYYAIGQVEGQQEKNKKLKSIEENTLTDISKLWT